ncbi:MAG: hypothetical protein GY859_06905 [Desulfobacterales bacterium]|nr:hypothetical protein [Desulfobacterales bacterium]
MKNRDKKGGDDPERKAARERVVGFFLDLYTYELGVTELEKASRDFKPLSTGSEGPDYAYELRVEHHGARKARRMSISLLGEETGSKSTCYKVAYDNVLVVKIPPDPIKGFDQYMAAIERERRVLDLLSPDIQCVTPGVTAILERIPRFSNKDDLPAEEYEARCIQMLATHPWLQDHLKIDGAFVFFMNLSKSSFFSRILEQMHQVDDRVDEEMDHYMGAMTEFERFESVHGKNNAAVFFDLNDVWSNYKMEMEKFLAQNDVNAAVPAYRMKEWLRIHLAGGAVRGDDGDLPAHARDALNLLLRKFVKANRETFEKYRSVVRARFRRESFIKNRASFKGVITNILKLLNRLQAKGAAARDLKPDNIFIAAAPGTTPPRLPSPETYSMGLIDLETAVNFRPMNEVLIKQPLLTGTPSYATPAHLFENEILAETIGELPRALYLQDWHAAIVMIHQTVVGHALFERSRKFIPEFVNMRLSAANANQSLVDVFKLGSNMYWNHAKDEFAEKMGKNREKLRSVSVSLSHGVRKMLGHELLNVKNVLDGVISESVFTQDIFKSDKSRERLIASPRAIITKTRTNWEKGVNVPKAPAATRKRIIHFLGVLEKLKRESDLQVRALKLLVQKQTEVTVLDLLELMFAVVHRTMYQTEWYEPPAEKTPPATDEETAAYEKTL